MGCVYGKRKLVDNWMKSKRKEIDKIIKKKVSPGSSWATLRRHYLSKTAPVSAYCLHASEIGDGEEGQDVKVELFGKDAEVSHASSRRRSVVLFLL